MGDSPVIRVSERQFQKIISSHPCFKHYINIPDRICSSLDFFDNNYNRTTVHGILESFYLFIGIVDHAMDSISISIATEVLKQLKQPNSFSENTLEVPYKLATELLKLKIHPAVYNTILDRFSDLCESVFDEQCTKKISEYIRFRKRIGSLTAEISYLLIEPFLTEHNTEILKLFCMVGEAGCLVDSLIDLRSDYSKGLINFTPNFNCYLKLLIHVAVAGVPPVWRHPKLIQIFYEAVVDNCRDLKR